MYKFLMGPLRDPEPQPGSGDPIPPPPQPPTSDPALQRMQADLQRMSEQQQAMLSRMQPAAQPSNAQPTQADLDKQFFKAPTQTVLNVTDALVQNRMQQMNQATFDTLRDVARKAAREGHEELFDLYATEIDLAVNEVPQFYHTNINTWKMARDKVFGGHILDIRNKAIEESKKAPAVHIGPGGPSSGTPRSPQAGRDPNKFNPDPVMTELGPRYERDVARGLGLSEEEYCAGRAHIAGQAFKGPSSWDPHITFDSAQRRKELRKQREKK